MKPINLFKKEVYFMEKMTNVKALNFVVDNFELPTDVREKIDNMIASLEKKSANRKPSKTQAENEAYKDAIRTALATVGKGVTVTELLTELRALDESLGTLSNQRVSALLRLMGDEIVKTVDKKKSYFSLAV
jgi:hypothetical protein